MLKIGRGQIGALPILQASKLCNKFQLKNLFSRGENQMFTFFTDCWHIGRVVLDPAVHYLGSRGVVSTNEGISAMVCLIVLTDNLP